MPIPTAIIKDILIGKGVTHLYHVNTVATALTFINHGGLLSRGTVEDLNLHQTPQQTDEKDKQLHVWYDVFFDSVDIHSRCLNVNHYGPVTFEYSIDVLNNIIDPVRITKENPQHWETNMPEDQRYFTSEQELDIGYKKGNFAQHLTICNCRTPIGFDQSLIRLILENPKLENTNHYNIAYEALQGALNSQGINLEVEERNCTPQCRCYQKYNASAEGYTYHRFKLE